MRNQFTMNTTVEQEIPVLYLHGDVTSSSDDEINRAYRSYVDEGYDKIVLNFQDVKYINSAGMATLLGLVTDMIEHKRQIKFVALSTHFKKIVEMIGMTEFVSIYNTNEEAIAEFE